MLQQLQAWFVSERYTKASSTDPFVLVICKGLFITFWISSSVILPITCTCEPNTVETASVLSVIVLDSPNGLSELNLSTQFGIRPVISSGVPLAVISPLSMKASL